VNDKSESNSDVLTQELMVTTCLGSFLVRTSAGMTNVRIYY